MSMNRLLTRLAAVSALNNFGEGPWPTIAGPNVFDSKIEPVDDSVFDRAFPTCVVYTDYDKDHWNKGNKVHQPRLLTLTLELLVVTAQKVGGDSATYQLDCPETDSEIETSLDIFEAQIYRALAAGNEASDCFSYLCPGYEAVISRRGASVEGGLRLAARQITLETRALRDPVLGTIPAEVAAFLDRLESQPDYAERVDDIRLMLTEPATWPPDRQLGNAFGSPRRVVEMLGGPTSPLTVLGPVLTFLNPQGGPFP